MNLLEIIEEFGELGANRSNMHIGDADIEYIMKTGGGIMPKQVTEYELLISCPSDVKDELNIINDTVDTFNRLFGAANNAKIVTKHWSKDSYPQSGGTPQKLLNEQFVLDCDAAVAVFWTRFGTPTDEYGSGTEEEIEELLKSGKQVFLYFSDRSVNPSQIDSEQYEKIKAFKERYRDRGLYWSYSDLADFKKDFLNHLTLHFVRLLNNDRSGTPLIYRSQLLLKGSNSGRLDNEAELFRTNYTHSKYINDLKQKTVSILNQIKDIKLSDSIISNESSKESDRNDDRKEPSNDIISRLVKSSKTDLAKLAEANISLNNLFPSELVIVNDKTKQMIDKFSMENEIELDNSFYNLGNLSRQKNQFVMGPAYYYNGTDSEKEKHELLNTLESLIRRYNESIKYLNEIDSKMFISLALCNSGTDYDEDIDVSIHTKKGCLCKPHDLPFPGNECLQMSIETFELFYKPRKSVSIDEYPNYFIKPSITRLAIDPIFGKSYAEKIKEKTDDFNDKKEKTFCYNFFENEDEDIMCYNQQYLKQNTNCFLPSYLVLNKVTDSIRYEIRSKRFPDVIQGELTIKELSD